MNGLQLISRSLRLVGALATGEVPDADEAQDALAALNGMLDAWSADRLSVFTVNRLGPFNLGTKQTYTYGAGGDINSPRPAKVDRYGIVILNNPLQPLELPLEDLTNDGWASIPVKNIQSTFPTKVWDDDGFPLRSLSFWPIPTAACQLVPYAWAALSQFADLVTDYEFPPAYLNAIVFNLAIDLAPEFGSPVSMEVAQRAIQYKSIIEAMNAPLIELRCDPALVNPEGQIYNWLTDGPVAKG